MYNKINNAIVIGGVDPNHARTSEASLLKDFPLKTCNKNFTSQARNVIGSMPSEKKTKTV